MEDEALVAMELEDMLETMGHEVVGKTARGEQAVDMAKSFEPDLVLMDIVLRGEMDGVEAAKLVQGEMNIPVVFVSAHTANELQRAKELKPYGFVVKPFEESQVQASIELALERKRTEGLVGNSSQEVEEYFRTLLEGARNAVLLVDQDLTIRQFNRSACELFKLDQEDLAGERCCGLFFGSDSPVVETIISSLDESQGWIGEVSCVKADGEAFPGEVTIRRISMGEAYCLLIIQDMTREKTLEQDLEKQRSKVQDMGITLRTLMDAVDEEKQEVMEALAGRITQEVFPALERMVKESSRETRESYKTVIMSELSNMVSGTSATVDSHLLSLTPTELKVCQYIQAGCTTKEIAEMTHSAFDTIQTHRKNIRKKLGLKGKKTTIYGFLQTSPNSGEEPPPATS